MQRRKYTILAAVLAALTLAVSCLSSPVALAATLRNGDKGDEVKEMQALLVELDFLKKADGIFGDGTEAAVISFQKANSLKADGLVGTATMAKMKAAVNSRTISTYLSKGDKGDEVKTLQKMLISAGYLSGSADGIFGENTEAAVLAFQKAVKISADGLAGSSTLKKLEEAAAGSTITQQLKLGSSGAQVKTLQNLLIKCGYLSGTADGEFGEATEKAVILFQTCNGLTADGVVGSKTIKALSSSNTTSSKGAQVVAEAMKYLGVKYVYGKSSPTAGFDCSGLVWYVYKQLGVTVPRTSDTLYGYGTKVASLSAARPGDILCWDGHVGIYIGNNKFIHAPYTGTVVQIGTVTKTPIWIARIFN